nr:MAG TPA: Protein of unknown function (DUF2730) [Caudoviricetes sp.]
MNSESVTTAARRFRQLGFGHCRMLRPVSAVRPSENTGGSMPWEIIKGNWAIIWALFMSAVNVIQLLLAKTYVKREELELMRTRLQGIENTIAGLPSQKDLHQLQLEMSNLRGDLRELGPAIRQVKHVSDLLLENELKEK